MVVARYIVVFVMLVGLSIVGAETVHADQSDAGVVATIDQSLSQVWEEKGLRPARAASDAEWARRVYLDVIGRVPTVKELDRYLRDRGRGSKERLIDRLLGEEYRDEYTRHWSVIWTNILIGRTGGAIDNDMVSRAGMESFLRDSFRYDQRYDDLAKELISATGTTTPGSEDFHGATNFLVGKLEENAVQATAKTSQIFLGVQTQCTQCHNHPFNENKQNQFWEMNAFFRQTRALRSYEGGDIASVRLVDEYFPGESGRSPENAEIYYELQNGLLKAAYPVFIDGTSLTDKYVSRGETFGNSGRVEDVNRREELADLVVSSPYFSKAIVNRMWAHFLGQAFTKPFDDLGPHNPPSHPELLADLAHQFVDADYDLKRLIRWITLSQPYGLSSRRTEAQVEIDDPSSGTLPYFSYFYTRQMEAEQLFASLLTVTEADNTLEDENERSAMRTRWMRQFVTAFGTDEGDEATTFNGSIPQALMMMNGDLIKKACGTEPGSFLYRVATSPELDNRERIRFLYRAALSRSPDKREIAAANGLLMARSGNVAEALQDIWWALLNSNEFIFNH